MIVAGGDRIESKKQDNKELKEDKKELIEANAKIKDILSGMSKLQIDPSKYAPFLLQEKDEWGQTSEIKNLANTPFGDSFKNENYAKLSYLAVANESDTFLDESNNTVTVGEYKANFEKKYGSSVDQIKGNIDKILYDAGYTLSNQNEKKVNATETSNATPSKEPNGFINSRTRLTQSRSKGSKFDDYLEEKIGEVLSVDWVKKDGSELADIGLPWREELAEGKEPTKADWEVRKNNEVIKNMSKDKIYAVIENVVVPEEKREKTATELSNYINKTYNNVTWKNPPKIDVEKEARLNHLFRKSFLVYTRMIMKNQIAEQYMSKVSDLISAEWEKLLIKKGNDGIEYDEKGWMRIKYHTAQAPNLEGEIYIDPNWYITMSDLMWLEDQNRQNEMKNTPRRLQGRLIPVNEMVQKMKDDRPTFSTQWHDRVLASDPKVYKDGDYTRALKSRVKDILSYHDNETLSEDLLHASMNHSLEVTKLFDTFGKFHTKFTWDGQQDDFAKYAKKSITDQSGNVIPYKTEYKSLFVIRNSIRSEMAGDINRFDVNVNRLFDTYTNAPKEKNPFLGEYANEKMRKLLESFVTNDRWTPRFSFAHFEKCVTAISKEKPANIDEWLMEDVKGRLEVFLPWWSDKFKELTKKGSEKEAEGVEAMFKLIPPAPWGGARLKYIGTQSLQPAIA